MSSLDVVMAEGKVNENNTASHQGGPQCSNHQRRAGHPPPTINIHATNDSKHASSTTCSRLKRVQNKTSQQIVAKIQSKMCASVLSFIDAAEELDEKIQHHQREGITWT